jgi:hypothetical protein
VPRGGTVAFVDPVGHRYLDDPVAREEGGTPGMVESVRAGLVVALKQAVGTDLIREREERFLRRALDRWRRNPNLELLGNLDAARLPIVSFRVRHGDRHLHHELVVAMLNDLFGIEARGGCSCAGPYGHRLLGIDPDRSRALSEQAGRGCLGIKLGWTRVSFNFFVSDAVADFLVDAVDLLAGRGHRLLGDYRFDPPQRPVAPPPGTARLGAAPQRAARRPGRPRPWAGRRRRRPGRLPPAGPGAARGRRSVHHGGGAELAAARARAAARLPPARRRSQLTAPATTTARATARPTLPVSRSTWRQLAPAAKPSRTWATAQRVAAAPVQAAKTR